MKKFLLLALVLLGATQVSALITTNQCKQMNANAPVGSGAFLDCNQYPGPLLG